MAANPIRILHLIASNFVGGPEKQILHHAVDVREAGCEVWVGSFRDQPEKAEILVSAQERGLPTYESRSSGRFDPRAVRELASFLKRERIQLLCTHGFKANTIGVLAKKLTGVPQIAFCRGWTAETPRVRAYEFLERCLLPFANRVVCVSEAQAKLLARNRRFRPRLAVVQNAMLETASAASVADRAALKAQLGFSPQTRLIGAIGRLSVEKGQRYLVEAAAELARDFHDLKIVLLGEGRERAALAAQIKQLGLDGVVLLPGFQKNIALWMQALDVLVNCSLTEGLPNVILEALAAETPVVATAVGGVPELIRDRETGLLVPAANPAALARALAMVLRDTQLADALRRSGRAWVQTRFSPARQRESLLAIYRQCLGLRPVSSAPSEQNEIQERAALPAESLPFISVVLPVRNEEAHLGAVLDSLLAQEYPRDRYEILVVDGNSTDGTARVVEEAAKASAVRIRLLPNPRQISGAGRNVGVRNSVGELIVFIDGHCWIPSRELLLNTARLFETTGAACLCRPQPLTAPGSTWFQKVVADVRATAIGHGLDSAIYSTELEDYVNPTSSGASYRRSVFDHVGFYDERLDACEDVELNYRVFRAGLRSYTSPRLTVQYAPRKTFSGLWKQMVRYGKGRYRFAGIHPEAFSFAQAVPAAFLLWLALGGAGALVSRPLATFFLATLAVYAGIVAASSVWLGIRQGWRHMVTAPAVYLTIHLGLGAGFLTEAARSIRQRFSFRRATQEVSSASAEGASFPRVRILRESGQDAPSGNHGTHRSKTTPMNAFSVDVEDYFHTEAMSGVVSREAWEQMPSRVENNTHRLFELLAKHDVRGTFFFLGWVAERFPGLVREAVQLGHEVGCHSYWHRPVYRLSPAEFRADTRQALKAIEDAGGVGVRGYRAPSFSMVPGTEWAAEILVELGFYYDSSVHPIRHDLYSNASAPRIPHRVHGGAILELPIATMRVAGNNLPVGGGGYFRILPYAYTRWGLSRLNGRESQPGVVYLHPWEIDPEQPRLAAGFKSRFRQYTGLAGAEHKLDRLLQRFSFAPISTVFRRELCEALAPGGNSREEKAALAGKPSPEPAGVLGSTDSRGDD